MIKKSKKCEKIIKNLLTITARGCIMKSQITPNGKMEAVMENGYSENICGYTVHTYYIDCPNYEKKPATARKYLGLRRFAFCMLAPLAVMADAAIALFK